MRNSWMWWCFQVYAGRLVWVSGTAHSATDLLAPGSVRGTAWAHRSSLQWLQVLGHVLVSLHGKGTSFSSRATQYLDWNCWGQRQVVLVKSSCPDGYQFALALNHAHISFPITTAADTEGPQAQHKMQRKQLGTHTAAHSLASLTECFIPHHSQSSTPLIHLPDTDRTPKGSWSV